MVQHQKRVYAIAVLFAVVVTIAGAVANANAPYDPGTATQLRPAVLTLWAMLYVPTLVLPAFGGWRLRDLGWSLGAIGLASCVLIVGLCGAVRVNAAFNWGDAAVEAVARTGEEVFTRGFIYGLIERAFRRRWCGTACAIVGSALLFTVVHTTAFGDAVWVGPEAPSATYVIIGRLSDIFLASVGLGLLRAATGSIIPGAFVHATANGGALTAPFVCLIVIAIGYWGQRRGEHLFHGITEAMRHPGLG